MRGLDWIELAEDRDRWRALVNVATNFWPPYNAGNFLTQDIRVVRYQQRLRSVKLSPLVN
jgi:hypothetical protein